MKVIGKKHYKQYTLKDVLGQGSFGKVYYSPPYAVKEMNFQGMSPFLINALKNQITILNQIHHPNVVSLVDFFYESSSVYLVMEYCEQDLSKYLKKNKIDQKMAIHIFKQLLSGFRELVKQGIIHRDLKPANILVNSRGEFKLADFGFAKFVDHYDSKILYSIVGTPLYMSPQILSKTQYTTKSDIWSLGFILYEMLTGTYPWMGVSESDLYKNITTRPLNIPSQISAYSKDLIIRMLKINQKERIAWEDLFQVVLNANKSPEKNRGNQQQQQPNQYPNQNQNQRTERDDSKQNRDQRDRNTSRKKVFPQTPNKDDRAKSNKKIQDYQNPQNIVVLQKNQQQQKKTVTAEIIKQIFILEYERIFGEQQAQKVALQNPGIVSKKDREQLQRVLQNFNQQFQGAVRSILKVGAK